MRYDVLLKKMSIEEYNAVIRKLKWPIGAALFGPLLIGMGGALLLTDRMAASSSWEREYVFLSMFPTLIAPILIACLVAETVDKRIGLKCECGQSLTFGRHVAYLMRRGGECPRCGELVVEQKNQQNKPE